MYQFVEPIQAICDGKSWVAKVKPWEDWTEEEKDGWSKYLRPEQPCLHENCRGCKDGTCSGVHMISCPCPKCAIRC